MIFANAKCKKCGFIFEIVKKSIQDDFIVGKCPECKSKNTYRMFNTVAYDVGVGMTGNYTTGYSKSITYHPSKFGKFKGVKV